MSDRSCPTNPIAPLSMMSCGSGEASPTASAHASAIASGRALGAASGSAAGLPEVRACNTVLDVITRILCLLCNTVFIEKSIKTNKIITERNFLIASF